MLRTNVGVGCDEFSERRNMMKLSSSEHTARKNIKVLLTRHDNVIGKGVE